MSATQQMTRRQMIEVLVMIQNTVELHNRDILTIAGLMTDEEMATHILANFKDLPASRKSQVLEVARQEAA